MKVQRVLLMLAGIILAAMIYFFGSTTDPSKKKGNAKAESVPSAQMVTISFEDYEAKRKSTLEPSYAKMLDQADSDTLKAHIWQRFNSPALAAWYFYRHAEEHKDADLLEQAGNLFLAASKSPTDTAVSNNCYTFALRSYEDARKLAPEDPLLIVKIAETYVDGSMESMKGIMMLQSLGDSLPDFLPAQISLGRFAVVSGQYQKAKDRLDKVLLKSPGNAEAMYFLAFAEEGLGNKDKAVALLEQCKILVGNPEFDKEINEYINSIKNK